MHISHADLMKLTKRRCSARLLAVVAYENSSFSFALPRVAIVRRRLEPALPALEGPAQVC